MAIAVKKVTLWRKEVANDPGVLANVLQPLAAAGANLRVVMGYTIPGESTRAYSRYCPRVSGWNRTRIRSVSRAGSVT